MDMEWKMSGIKGKLVSVRQKAFKALRLISGVEKEDANISSPTPTFAATAYEPVNALTNYSLEAELKKAQALAHWKRWQDRPK
jgi:hypothetical protein